MTSRSRAGAENPAEKSPAVVAYAGRGTTPDRMAAVLRFAGRSVLDVGCGSGAYVLQLAERYDIRGCDYKYFDSWSEHPELFSLADAAAIDVPAGSVDTVLSFETLEHLRDPAMALHEYFRITRGNLILTVPNCALGPALKRSGVIYSHWSDPTHLHFFDMHSITAAVQAAGFKVRHSALINRVNIGPAVMEVLGLSGSIARLGARVFGRLQRLPYRITCLVVAEKPTGVDAFPRSET